MPSLGDNEEPDDEEVEQPHPTRMPQVFFPCKLDAVDARLDAIENYLAMLSRNVNGHHAAQDAYPATSPSNPGDVARDALSAAQALQDASGDADVAAQMLLCSRVGIPMTEMALAGGLLKLQASDDIIKLEAQSASLAERLDHVEDVLFKQQHHVEFASGSEQLDIVVPMSEKSPTTTANVTSVNWDESHSPAASQVGRGTSSTSRFHWLPRFSRSSEHRDTIRSTSDEDTRVRHERTVRSIRTPSVSGETPQVRAHASHASVYGSQASRTSRSSSAGATSRGIYQIATHHGSGDVISFPLSMPDMMTHEEGLKYDFTDTVWDLMSFCGLSVLPMPDQVCLVFVLVVNLAIQISFVVLVAFSMLDNRFIDDEIVTTLRDWRVLYAHNPDFADSFTNTPLAKDVCQKSLFLMQGVQQAALYKEIEDYTTSYFGVPGGGALCVLSVFLWLLTCAKEGIQMVRCLLGHWGQTDDSTFPSISSIETTGSMRSRVEIQEDPRAWINGEAKIKRYQLRISQRRAVVLTIFVFVPRAILLIVTLIVGCHFLIQTTELTELILNSVALEVVLNVDELLFEIFAPQSAKSMVHQTLPLFISQKACGLFKQTAPWLQMVAMLACFLVIGFGYLGPMVRTMTDVKHVMCGGTRDFLAVQMQFGAVVVGAIGDSSILRTGHEYRAILQRTGLQHSIANATATLGCLYLEGGIFRFENVETAKAWRDRTMSETAGLPSFNPHSSLCLDSDTYCAELTDTASYALRAGIGSKLDVVTHSCGDLEHLCYNRTTIEGQIARFVCPFTCGVHQIYSGLFFDTVKDAASRAGQTGLLVSLANASCQDLPLSQLITMPGWRRYAEGASTYFNQWLNVPDFQPFSQQVHNSSMNSTGEGKLRNYLWDGMSTLGCEFFERAWVNPLAEQGSSQNSHEGQPVNLCDVDLPRLEGRRSVRYFCPVTCGCSSSVRKAYRTRLDTSISSIPIETQCPLQCLLSHAVTSAGTPAG